MFISEKYIEARNPLIVQKKKPKAVHHDEAVPEAKQKDKHYSYVSPKDRVDRAKEQDRRRMAGK